MYDNQNISVAGEIITRQPTREKTAAWTAAWGIAYQFVTAFTQFIALGLLIRLVGREQFGLWMVIYALTTWAPLLTLGQTNVLLTRLGRTGFSNSLEARQILTSSVMISLLGSGLALLFVLGAVLLVPWESWLNIQNRNASTQIVPTALAAITVAILAVPLSLSSFALLACRRGVLGNQVMIGAQIIGLLVFLFGIMARWPLWALGAVIIAPLAVAGAILTVVGIRKCYIPRPSFASFDTRSTKSAIGLGLTIFLFDLATIFLQRTPELIIARFRGLDEVAAFTAVSRLSMFLLAILQALILATWPMVSEAAGKKDWAWVKRGLLGCLAMLLLVWTCGGAAIWLGGPLFIAKWTGIPHLVSDTLFLAVIFQSLSQGLQSWIFMALSSLALYRVQLFAVISAAIVYFLVAQVLAPKWGATGVVLAQSFAFLLVALPIGLGAMLRRIRLGVAGE